MSNDLEQADKARREMKEFLTQFKGQTNGRQMWQSLAQSSACRKAIKPIPRYKTYMTKEGPYQEETEESQIECGVYNNLVNEYGEENVTEAMMTNACQVYLARTNPASAAFARDTGGGKPVDESKMNLTPGQNPYESLDNEQLAAIAQTLEALETKRKEVLNNERQPNPNHTTIPAQIEVGKPN